MIKDQIGVLPILSRDEDAERLSDMGKNKLVITNDTAKQQKRQSRKARILVNPDVKRWYDNLARGSPLTAEVRIRRLDKFCEIHDMTPIQLSELGMKDLRTVTDLIEDHITWMESKNYSPGYVEDVVKAVKSWLRHFDIEIKRKLKVTNPEYTPTLQDERVPNAEEMSEIFNRATLRASVTISLMAKSGLRPEVMGNYDGTDGLTMNDLPDVVIHQGVAKCISAPNRIIVRRELSKARHQYFTYSTTSATKKLLAYLNDRLAFGEPLHGDSPVVAPDYEYKTGRGNNKGKPFLPTQQICNEIRNTFRPRFKWRPYVLRAYYRTQTIIAEAQGKTSHSFACFWFGHKGDMSSRYSTNKGILPDTMLKEMRESFKRCEELLDLDLAKEDPILKQKEQMQNAIQNATPEELGQVLEVFQSLNIGKTNQVKKL
ncbi:MAG: hypothetical protein IIA83_08170 [Thaumarchaeota archaeon]|nr:hypothetical protein [Nitrososphaerota archaeon]